MKHELQTDDIEHKDNVNTLRKCRLHNLSASGCWPIETHTWPLGHRGPPVDVGVGQYEDTKDASARAWLRHNVDAIYVSTSRRHRNNVFRGYFQMLCYK